MGWVWLRVLFVGSIRRVVFCWEEDGHDWQGFFVNAWTSASQVPLQPVVVMQSCEGTKHSLTTENSCQSFSVVPFVSFRGMKRRMGK